MYPNPPLCETCGQPMRHVATIPAVGAVGRKTILFQCEPCDRVKWIEDG
jgi:hypothetical protein